MSLRLRQGWWETALAASWHPYAWIGLAVFAVYARSVFFGFTFLDDTKLILYNAPFLTDIGHILQAFRQKVFVHGYLAYYRPLLVISFICDAQWNGVAPFAFHAMNILIHGIASCLVFLLFVRLEYTRIVSAFFALVFSVHPLLVQAVAWIPGRNDSLLAVFALSSFICFVDLIERPNRVSLAGHLIFFAAALLTKETAIVLPLLSVVYFFLRGRQALLGQMTPGRLLGGLIVGYGIIAAVWFALRAAAVGTSFQLSVYAMLSFLVQYLPAIPQLIGKAFFPVNLSVFPIMQDVLTIPGYAALALMALLLFLSPEARPWRIGLGAIWIILFLVPSLLRPHAGVSNDVLEHRFYLPMVGLMIILLELDIFRSRLRKGVFAIVAVLVVIICGVLAYYHAGAFRDRRTFWESAVMTSPHAPFAWLALGSTYYASGEFDRAIAALRRSASLDSQMIQTNYYLGLIALERGDLKAAERSFRKEVALNPRFTGPYSSLGVICYRQGRGAEAEAWWRKGLLLRPDDIEILRNLAIYCREAGRRDEALRYAERLQVLGVPVPDHFRSVQGDRQ